MNDKRQQFAAVVLPHLDAACHFARWLTRSPGDADDLVQDAMLRAYRAFGGFRGADARAWLFAIVRNCHFTALEQRQRRAQVPLPEDHDARDGHFMIEPSPGPEASSMRRDDECTLERLVATLPEPQRAVLVLREIEELDYREIAQATNTPIGTVMSRLARARAALRSKWQEECHDASHAVR